MTNKLRVYVLVLGGGLAAVSLWGTAAYDGSIGSFVAVAAIGALVAATPYVIAYGKLLLKRRRQAGLDEAIFGSPRLDVDRDTFFETSMSALESAEKFVGVKRREFPEGTGLVVDHTKFHGTFVRLSRQGEAVVTGLKSNAASAVIDELQKTWSCTFSRRRSNPFLRPIPVRGLPRGLLTIALTAVIILDGMFLVGIAYPSSAYNPGEKATMIGYDLRASIDPTMDSVDTKLAKAGFLIAVLKEEANEVRWQAGVNNSSKASVNDAAAISAHIGRLLNAAGEGNLNAEERARLARLRMAHERARTKVQAAMAEPAPSPVEPNIDNPFDADSNETTPTPTGLSRQ